MDQTASSPIVVGIDGSKHAVRAAVWAVDEAVSRDTQLLLVSVIDGHSKDLDREYAHATHALHKAWIAAEATGKPVKLESSILEGDPVTELVEVSRSAEMVCVGSRGTNNSHRQQRGSTAAELAQSAFSPVAIVRRRHTHEPVPAGLWIVAALADSTGTHGVLETALDEALLREAPVLALVRRPTTARSNGESKDDDNLRAKLRRYLEDEQDDNAEVQVCTLPMSDHISNLIAQSADIDQLIIVGSNHPDLVADVIGPQARAVLRHTNCSILIVREQPRS